MAIQREHQIYRMIAEYLQMQYPHVVYRFDLAADLKLTAGQAARHKKLHPVRGYPDLFIAEPRGGYHGLFIEIKADGNPPFKKDGGLRSGRHLAEQDAMLLRLRDKGYQALFAMGFEGVRRTIKEYMEAKNV